MTAETPLLEIENLYINFMVDKRQVQAVQGLNLTVYQAKPLPLLVNLGLASPRQPTPSSICFRHGAVTQGSIKYEGNDLVKLPKRKRRAYRGSRIGLVHRTRYLTSTRYTRWARKSKKC